MDKLKYVKLENPDGSYSESIPLSVDSDYVDVNGTDLTNKLKEKANNSDIDILRTEINNIGNGSPKASYSTIEALISANPVTGVYLVLADGYTYSFTHNTSTAVQLTQYQSTGIAKNSVNLYELSPDLNSQLNNIIRIQTSVDKNLHYRISNGVAYQSSYVGYSSFVTPVSAGEIYHLRLKESSVNTYGYIFVDNLTNMNVIDYGMRGTSVAIWQEQTVKVPIGATYMLSSYYGVETDMSAYLIEKVIPYSIQSLNKAITKNFAYVTPKYEAIKNSYYEIQNGKGVYKTLSSVYRTVTLDVSEGDAFYIKGSEHSAKTQLYLVLDSEDNILLSGGYGDYSSGYKYYEANIIIPENGIKLCITFSSTLGSTEADFILQKKEPIASYLSNKDIAILGDSISTKINKNAVEMEISEDDVGKELSAYLTYYDVQAGLTLNDHVYGNNEIGTEVTFVPNENDIGKVIGLANNYNGASTTTYWELLEENFNCNVTPVCWSGASLSSHEKNSNQYKTSYGWHDAQIRKIGTRKNGTMERKGPDLVIIYRGANDFSHSPYVSIDTTSLDNYNYEYPTDDYNETTTKYDYVSALGMVVKKIRETYPTSRIAICTLGIFKRVHYDHYPTNNGMYSLPQFNEMIRKCANYFGLDLIELDKDGITFENCYSEGYITDSATTPTHPNSKGHEMIYKQVVKDLQKYE